jgi:hypothetical protein
MSLGSENGLSVADIAAVTDRNNGNCGGMGGWGGGFGEMLIAMIMLFLFPMFFGGFGGGMWGGMGGWGNGGMMAAANGALTRADLCSEFNFNGLENAVRGVTQGLCDGFYAMQGSINNLGTTVMQGFSQAELSRANQQAALMQQLFNLGYQQKDCCCETQRSIDGVRFTIAQEDCATRNLMQSNTRDLIENQNANARAVMDALTAQRLEAKDERIAAQAAQIQALQLSASQAQQNAAIGAMISASEATILRRTGAECPTPAYVVQPPTPVNFPTNCCGQFNGWGNGCGGCNGCAV